MSTQSLPCRTTRLCVSDWQPIPCCCKRAKSNERLPQLRYTQSAQFALLPHLPERSVTHYAGGVQPLRGGIALDGALLQVVRQPDLERYRSRCSAPVSPVWSVRAGWCSLLCPVPRAYGSACRVDHRAALSPLWHGHAGRSTVLPVLQPSLDGQAAASSTAMPAVYAAGALRYRRAASASPPG